jgi:hypothetical protein
VRTNKSVQGASKNRKQTVHDGDDRVQIAGGAHAIEHPHDAIGIHDSGVAVNGKLVIRRLQTQNHNEQTSGLDASSYRYSADSKVGENGRGRSSCTSHPVANNKDLVEIRETQMASNTPCPEQGCSVKPPDVTASSYNIRFEVSNKRIRQVRALPELV